tara:strand:- start:779 stop:1117 length:339 start_codon:yes stop_codon:yes gene_type:complete
MINKHSFYIDEAIKEAKKSCMVKKHGCIIIKNNKIIGKGYNEYIKGMNNIYSIHAEKKAILNAKKNNDIKNSVLYVVRINNNNELDKSCPCLKCRNFILENNISKIYYSSNI